MTKTKKGKCIAMMKLSLMDAVIRTVSENRESTLAATIATPWEYEEPTLKFYRASANFIFSCLVHGQKCFLRFNHTSERTEQMLTGEVELLKSLSAAGIAVAEPVLSRNGRYVERVETSLGEFHAVLFKGLSGQHIELEDMTDDLLVSWGRFLAKVHNGISCVPASGVALRPNWEALLDFASGYIGSTEQKLMLELQNVKHSLSKLPQTDHNYGLIHFDFESDNILWGDGGVAALDFDDCTSLWYAADIIFALRDMFNGKVVDYGDPRLALFLQGYRQEREMNDAELINLPLFLRLHRLFFIARLRRSVDIVDTSVVPDWMKKLSSKLSQKVDVYMADINRGEVICR